MPSTAWLKAIAIYGAPTVATLYFVWWTTGMLAAKVDATNELLRPHVLMGEDLRRTLKTIVEIQRIQCVNDADTAEQRRACLRAGDD